jgi:hypothetical protein
MANTFRVHTKAAVGTSAQTIYTVGSGITTIILGLVLGNVTGSAVNVTVTLESDTAHDDGAGSDFTNGNVELVTSPSRRITRDIIRQQSCYGSN